LEPNTVTSWRIRGTSHPATGSPSIAAVRQPPERILCSDERNESGTEVSGFEWALVALGAAAALLAFDAALMRRRRRRRNALALRPDRSQLLERRIEVVPIDDAQSTPTPDPKPLPHERRDAYEQE